MTSKLLATKNDVLEALDVTPMWHKRELYLASDGCWYITYGGGRVAHEVVASLVSKRIVVSKYPDDEKIKDQVYVLLPASPPPSR